MDFSAHRICSIEMKWKFIVDNFNGCVKIMIEFSFCSWNTHSVFKFFQHNCFAAPLVMWTHAYIWNEVASASVFCMNEHFQFNTLTCRWRQLAVAFNFKNHQNYAIKSYFWDFQIIGLEFQSYSSVSNEYFFSIQ